MAGRFSFRSFSHRTKAGLILQENDFCFFPGKIDLAGNHPGIEPVQVFEQVKTGTAVHLGQVKCNVYLLFVLKTDQLQPDLFIIQEGKLIMPYPYPLVDPGIIVQVIIIAKLALVEDIIDHFAAVAAKHFFFRSDPGIQAGFATVVAMNFLFGKYCRGHKR
jgi:hypothetical protein